MLINNWNTSCTNEKREVAASVDGYNLWYRVPESYQVSGAAEPFVAAALIPAMLKGEEIDVDPGLTVSRKFLTNLNQLQEIYHGWNSDLKIIQINANTSEAESLNDGVFSFFSGGVDSSYTFLKHQEELSHIVFILGFDFFCDSFAYEKAIKRNNLLVQRFSKTLIAVETNFYQFGYHYNLSRNLTQGSCLGSVALLLGFKKVFIPSSYSYGQLFPLGSHPLTDPLWSNGSVEILHDGCEATRTEKLNKLISNDAILSNLTVCFNDINTNCGYCPKCLRTMISLRLLNVSSEAFPSFPSIEVIKNKRIDGQIEAAFLKENIVLATQANAAELKKALVQSLRRYQRIKLYKNIDKVLLNGTLHKVHKKNFQENSTPPRIDLKPEII
jgi:hypothetical protein